MALLAHAKLRTARLVLEPMRVAHAPQMTAALADPALYEFTGGTPPTHADLTARYERLESGRSPDGSEAWLNWAIRDQGRDSLAGYVQATVRATAEGDEASIAWVVAADRQGEGLATEAASAMVAWLRDSDVKTIVAWAHPEHTASAAVARKLGMVPTSETADGEVRWILTAGRPDDR